MIELEDDSLQVVGGQVRLQQVMVNLISNALDSMQDEARPRVEIATNCQEGRVFISVTDFGTGIAPDVANQIFDPFFTTKRVGKGLGLGLAISYNIVRDFGGKMSAKNNDEKGAVFILELDEAIAPVHEDVA